ncbi:hypothetical protein MYCTH_2307847 [Thermothelomyces thermophilus ATCC 42464]|uniref:Calcineurin-like phosphoesterase domain-containing protein n=1 Tax=Thermothelomyces thermophilus (strain ATCC 42464 / BCRC 31852 / DSM 1799) TaxID=573729 RepID=G2QIB3_THET4|nr:uncharacterized protein MYCTH_2307847 [Thermothelomyces thermophilus ATCC 42464]AEO59494.1 hypothetical protein MYCTH_2307847 [Thermothelomyces thermophilus ATCC 42464]
MTRLIPTAILRNVLRYLIPLSIALTLYLYLYPVFNTCAFPLPPDPSSASVSADTGRAAFVETAKVHWHTAAGTADHPTIFIPSRPPAPFRLLALGDPQLEGDTSIPTDYLGVFPHAKSLFRHATFRSRHSSLRQRIRQSFHDLVDIVFEDTFNALESLRKRIDLVGNDLYLAHIYRTVRWWSRPTHVTVLGDLLGSQWINNEEFYRRAGRYWNRVFRGAERVPDDVAAYPAEEYDLAGRLGGGPFNESTAWVRRVINVAGNHDIGYAGDLNDERAERFERAFGKLNYELRFELPLTNASLAGTNFDADPSSTRLVPELRIIVLNDMNLDTPVISTKLQDETYAFVNKVISTSAAVEFKGHFTVILTHIPLYKPVGVCVDDPFFDFHQHDGSLREQNQLSVPASKGFLEGILGMSGDVKAAGRGRGRPGIILNGHDHEGCDTWHYINQSVADPEQRSWEVKRWRQAKTAGIVGRDELPGVREVTVRSMMGGFGGNAGLLSIWFDEASWEWRTEYATCPLGTQHLWWLVHILDLIVLAAILLLAVAAFLSASGLNVDRAVQESAAKLSTPQKKLARPNTPAKRSALAKGGGSG